VAKKLLAIAHGLDHPGQWVSSVALRYRDGVMSVKMTTKESLHHAEVVDQTMLLFIMKRQRRTDAEELVGSHLE